MSVAPVTVDQVHRLTSAEYERIVDSGALAHAKVELLDGLLVETTPQGVPHFRLIQALMRLFGDRLDLVRIQGPLACAEGWYPEPDVALAEDAHPTRHPSTAFLAVEVADSRTPEALVKLEGYARARVMAVWIVEVSARAVRVFEEPTATRYARERVVRGDEPLDPGVDGIAPFTVEELFAAARV